MAEKSTTLFGMTWFTSDKVPKLSHLLSNDDMPLNLNTFIHNNTNIIYLPDVRLVSRMTLLELIFVVYSYMLILDYYKISY